MPTTITLFPCLQVRFICPTPQQYILYETWYLSPSTVRQPAMQMQATFWHASNVNHSHAAYMIILRKMGFGLMQYIIISCDSLWKRIWFHKPFWRSIHKCIAMHNSTRPQSPQSVVSFLISVIGLIKQSTNNNHNLVESEILLEWTTLSTS